MGDVPSRAALPMIWFDARSTRTRAAGGLVDIQAEPAHKVTPTAFGRPMVAVTLPVAGSTRWSPPCMGVTQSEPAPAAATLGMLTRVRVTAPAAGLIWLTDPSRLP